MKQLKQALLGVQQEGLGQLEAQEMIRQLVQSAGIRHIYKEAGDVPQKQELRVPHRRAAEPYDICSAEAADLLSQILEGRHADLLAEHLALFKRSQTSIPAYLLPSLLDKASKVHALRPELLEVMPETGFYLAAQHSDWGYAEAPEVSIERLQKDWQSTSSSLRQGIFYQARLQNPAMARTLMQTTWKAESPASVNWIIRLMATGLSIDDEPFLELALDDRNLTVRRKASDLLACLPDSRLAARMTEVAQEYLRLDGSEIFFEQPEIKPEFLRDGFLLRAWKDETKLKQAYLADLVGAVPLVFWQENWHLEPAELLALALDSENREGMVKGLAIAAERQQNRLWMTALIKMDYLSVNSLKLISHLDEKGFLEVVSEFAQSFHSNDHAVAKAFSRWTVPWTVPVFELWQEHIKEIAENLVLESKHLFMLRSLFKQTARFAPASCFKQLAKTLDDYADQTELTAAIQESQSLLTFRQRMYQAVNMYKALNLTAKQD